jgi:chromosome segregation ATPase
MLWPFRLDRMDFIPLDSCEARPLSERLRHLGGTATPALDLLAYDPTFERAAVHVCGCVQAMFEH